MTERVTNCLNASHDVSVTCGLDCRQQHLHTCDMSHDTHSTNTCILVLAQPVIMHLWFTTSIASTKTALRFDTTLSKSFDCIDPFAPKTKAFLFGLSGHTKATYFDIFERAETDTPSAPNSNDQSTTHSVCGREDSAHQRSNDNQTTPLGTWAWLVG